MLTFQSGHLYETLFSPITGDGVVSCFAFINLQVLLIALISSDEWWLRLDWISTVNAPFLKFILHNATLHVACYYTTSETISSASS